jgi:hypothetical protein
VRPLVLAGRRVAFGDTDEIAVGITASVVHAIQDGSLDRSDRPVSYAIETCLPAINIHSIAHMASPTRDEGCRQHRLNTYLVGLTSEQTIAARATVCERGLVSTLQVRIKVIFLIQGKTCRVRPRCAANRAAGTTRAPALLRGCRRAADGKA